MFVLFTPSSLIHLALFCLDLASAVAVVRSLESILEEQRPTCQQWQDQQNQYAQKRIRKEEQMPVLVSSMSSVVWHRIRSLVG